MADLRLILGTVQFGLNYGIANREGKPDLDKVRGILRRAADHGIRMLDTAAGYGDSESILGKLLAEDPALRRNFRIVSKVTHMPADIPEERAATVVADSVKRSLANLQADQVYGILFHHENDLRHLPVLKSLQKQGLIEQIGFSADGMLPGNAGEADIIQVPGNVFDRRFIPYPRQDKPRRLFVRSVYLQGLLLMPEDAIPSSLKEAVPYRRGLEKIAAEAGMEPAELYMRYLFSHPEIDAVLTGVDNTAQLDVNAGMAKKGALPQDILAAVQALVPELPERLIRPTMWNAGK